MKKIILMSATAFLIILSGCQSAGAGSPKDTLNHFFNALAKKDFADAKKYATKDSDGMISMMEMGMQNMDSGHADKMVEMTKNMEIGNAVINGDQSTISVKDKKSGESTDFLLKKENGNWKVAFDMSTLMEMANKKMEEHGMNGMGNIGGMDSAQMNENMDSANPVMKEKMNRAKKMMDSLKAIDENK